MELFESAQDYLERILMLEEERGENKVRAIDVANSLGFSRASVSIAMHRLEESGYLTFGRKPVGKKPSASMKGIRSSPRPSCV